MRIGKAAWDASSRRRDAIFHDSFILLVFPSLTNSTGTDTIAFVVSLAEVVELVDTRDLKSLARKGVRVRPPSSA